MTLWPTIQGSVLDVIPLIVSTVLGMHAERNVRSEFTIPVPVSSNTPWLIEGEEVFDPIGVQLKA